MQHNKTKTHTEPKNVKTAYEWVEWVTATGKPNGVDDAHWAELTPKQKGSNRTPTDVHIRISKGHGMKKWTVEVTLCVSYNLEAESQEDAELRALDMFDANDGVPFVHDSWTDEDEEILEELIAQQEEREHAAELENFDPITVLEKQEQTGELK